MPTLPTDYPDLGVRSLAGDTARLDTGARGRLRPLVVALLIGALLGAGVGLLVAATRPASATATVSLSVLPDTAVVTPPGSAGVTQDATSFVQSQLVVLGGAQFAETVRDAAGLDRRPDLRATQVGQTYVVDIAATADDAATATRVATAAATVYTETRTGALATTIDARRAELAAQLRQVGADLQAATPAATPGTTTAVTPQQTALQSRYADLLEQDGELATQRAGVDRVVTVLATAQADDAADGRRGTAAVTGAIAGAVVAVVALLVWRRVRPAVRSVADLVALDVPVLLPALPATRGRGPAAFRSAEGRLLAARLVGRPGARSRPLVVVGTTPRSGTSHVAATLAAAFADRGPVLLVLAGGLVRRGDDAAPLAVAVRADHGGPRATDVSALARVGEIPGVWVLPLDGGTAGPLPSARGALLGDAVTRALAAGWQVIVDAPALSESDLAVDAAPVTGVSVLVAARGRARPADVRSAVDVLEARGVRLAGVVLDEVPLRARRPASTGPVDAGREDDAVRDDTDDADRPAADDDGLLPWPPERDDDAAAGTPRPVRRRPATARTGRR